jgi:2,3-diaminopropionate biosynthesis protein SbnB
MIYLNASHVQQIGIPWPETVTVIENAVRCLHSGEFAQPVKPYLRYRDLNNRIIAMPAFVGGNINVAGIKWIASFPGNIEKGIPRAHSVVVLNHADTGEPTAVINTALLSVIRTASVTGLMIRYYNEVRPLRHVNLGIVGWGPIGQHHFKMCMGLFGDRIARVFLYDIRGINLADIDFVGKEKIVIADNWQQAYLEADIFITCTVSEAPYIDREPKRGSLQLNVSLRDYKTDIYDYVKDAIVVDDWEEVCREKTDIDMLHKERGLNKEDTRSIVDVVVHRCLNEYPAEQPVLFNPMGMAVFDMAMAAYYFHQARDRNIGLRLE